MATVIRLSRGGRKKRPFYSVVVLDSRKRRDGAFIEKLGYYDPCTDPEVVELNLDRVQAWVDQGAQISPRVQSVIKLAQIDPETRAKQAAEKKAAAEKAAAEKIAAEKIAAEKIAAEKKAAEEAAAAEKKAAEEAAAAEQKAAEEAAAAEAVAEEEAPAEEPEAAEKADEEKADS